MLTTTRLSALFISLLRPCACAGGNNSKKIIMIAIFAVPLSLARFVLHPERLLSDYLKYLRVAQPEIPSVTSRVFVFKSEQANALDQKLFFPSARSPSLPLSLAV